MDLDSLEAAYSEAFGLFEELENFEFLKEPDFRATVGLHYPTLYNNVFCSRFLETHPEFIEKVVSIFKKNNSSFYWRVWPIDIPQDLHQRLLDNGFSLVGKNVLLAANRQDLKNLDRPKQAGICERVVHRNQMQDWCDVFEAGFQLSPAESQPFLRLFEKNSKRLSHFIVRHQERAIGIMSAIPQNSYMGFYNGAVLPEFRRQGFYRQLFDYVQKEALTSSQFQTFYGEVVPATYPELKRNGYQDLCFTQHYRWDFKA